MHVNAIKVIEEPHATYVRNSHIVETLTCSDCSSPKPHPLAQCFVIDDNLVWVYNGTLTVDNSTTIESELIVLEEFVVTMSGVLVLENSTVRVFGCIDLQDGSTLELILTEEQIQQLINGHLLNVTLLVYNSVCQNPQFDNVRIKNEELNCVTWVPEQKSAPGLLTVLVTSTDSCNIQTPAPVPASVPTTQAVPDWAIAVIVVGGVVIAGGVIVLGVMVRKQQRRVAIAHIVG
jgi:hypothetical protein